MVTTKGLGRWAGIAGAGLIAVVLAFGTAGVASASASAGLLEVCNEANNFQVDIWDGSSLLGSAKADSCATIPIAVAVAVSGGSSTQTVQFFVDNQAVPTEIGQITYPVGEGMTVTIDSPNAWFWTRTA